MSQTVFVIGAGACVDLGFPVGATLRDQIASDLAHIRPFYFDPKKKYSSSELETKMGGARLYSIIDSYCKNHSDFSEYYEGACEQISESLPLARSIDQYLTLKRDDKKIQFVGKTAIAHRILLHELMSPLYPVGDFGKIPFDQLSGSWHIQLFNLLIGSGKDDNIEERLSRTTFIVFNYDRCLEFFLWFAISHYLGCDYSEAKKILGSATFIHPYGLVGGFDWENAFDICSFGQNIETINLDLICRNLYTYDEQNPNENRYVRPIQETIFNASTLCFLGFGFLEQNMNLLFQPIPSGTPKRKTQVFASALGLSTSNKDVIRSNLYQKVHCLNPTDIHLFDSDCKTLMSDLEFTLLSKLKN